MEKIRIITGNHLKMINPVQAAANSFASFAGFTDLECFNVEVVIEELLSNVIKFDFLPGQNEEIEILIKETTAGLEIQILSKSIPLDIEKIKSFEHIDAHEIISHHTAGLGTLLVKNLVNKTQYINHGKDGQEIRVEIYRKHHHDDDEKASPEKPVEKIPPGELKYHIRKLKPAESFNVSRLAYVAYHTTYVYDTIYYPDKVKELNESGDLMSYVAINSEADEIFGHCANIKDPHSNMYEVGLAFVHPDYRGHGCLNELLKLQLAECRNRKIDGAFAHAVTTHPFSQKSLIKLGFNESAIMLSYFFPVKMTSITENPARESLVFMYIPLAESYHKIVYLPYRHRKILKEIYDHTGVSPEYRPTAKKFMPQRAQTKIQVKTDTYLSAKIYLEIYGEDALARIGITLKSLCVSRVETIYLNLPLNKPETAFLCSNFEEMGFFFSGVQPGFDDNDWLVLQYLNNQIYPYEKLQFASDFGRSLVKYVQSCDPNQ